jgi:hypothetical protein
MFLFEGRVLLAQRTLLVGVLQLLGLVILPFPSHVWAWLRSSSREFCWRNQDSVPWEEGVIAGLSYVIFPSAWISMVVLTWISKGFCCWGWVHSLCSYVSLLNTDKHSSLRILAQRFLLVSGAEGEDIWISMVFRHYARWWCEVA